MTAFDPSATADPSVGSGHHLLAAMRRLDPNAAAGDQPEVEQEPEPPQPTVVDDLAGLDWGGLDETPEERWARQKIEDLAGLVYSPEKLERLRALARRRS
jgi:hypothetical protein